MGSSKEKRKEESPAVSPEAKGNSTDLGGIPSPQLADPPIGLWVYLEVLSTLLLLPCGHPSTFFNAHSQP